MAYLNDDSQIRTNQLKLHRKAKNLTLEQLAEKTGLTASYLSKIERGLSEPSAETVQKLCYALSITANELMLTHTGQTASREITAEDSYLLPADERPLIYSFGKVLTFESVFEENPHFKVNVLTFPEACEDGMRSVHSYDEFGIVARGTLELTLGEDRHFQVHEGECIMVRAQTPHNSRCLSPEGCVSYWIEILDK